MADSQETDSLYLNQLKFDQKLFSSPIYFILKNTRILFLAVFALIGAGLYSFINLPRELNPEVEIPVVSVVTSLPGANPFDVEELITEKIEQEVGNISTIDTMTSVSQDSVSIVSIQFSSITDPDEALVDVKEKVDLVDDLPEDATTPVVSKLDFNDQPVLQVALVGDVDSRSLTKVAQKLQDELEAVSGIRKVELSGEEEEEIIVSLKPDALQEYGISADQVSQLIQMTDVTLPAGNIVVNQTEYQLTVDNQVLSVSELRSLPVSQGTEQIVLGEVADVYVQSQDSDVKVSYLTEELRQQAIVLSVYKNDSATIIDAANTAQTFIDEYIATYDQVDVTTIVNYSDLIQEDFTSLGSNFRDTIILVFTVLFLFLGLRQAGIASLSIPLTFLSTFLIMNIVGITLNFLSLFSLLLSLGLVVDDAIVIVQASHRYGQKFPPVKMGLLVFRDFVVPIWTTTLTTVWAFLPLVLSTGIIGEFIKSIPVVVSATLISSTTIAVLVNLPFSVLFAKLEVPNRLKISALLLSGAGLTLGVVQLISGAPRALVIATLVTWLVVLTLLVISRNALANKYRQFKKSLSKKVRIPKQVSRFFASRNIVQDGLVDFSPIAQGYRKLLIKILESRLKRFIVYAIVTVFFIVSIIFQQTGLLRVEFFPVVDSEQIYIGVEGPPGWSQDSTRPILSDVAAKALAYPEVSEVFIQTGRALPAEFETGGSGPHTGYVTVLLPKEEERDRSSVTLVEEMRHQFASENRAKVTIAQESGGPPAGADLQVNIKGSDLDELEIISSQFLSILNNLNEAVNVDTSLKQSPGQIKVVLNEAELRERNLSALQVGGWLRTAVTGLESSSIKIEDQDVDIVVTFTENELSLSDLKNIELPSQFGGYTLDEIAYFTLETSPVSITREDGARVVRVTAGANAVSAPELLAAFSDQADEVVLPVGYTWDVGGANEENQESTQSIIQAMGLSVILILVTMVMQLNSFRKSILVLIVIPLAVAGVFFNFTLFGIPLSFPALIGVLALFGIVVNNSIMLVEKVNQNIKFGLPFTESVVDACSSRIEPIFFTSLTTTIGLLPITISDPLWRGLGGAIIAGLTVSGTLILFLLPAMYVEVFASSEGKTQK